MQLQMGSVVAEGRTTTLRDKKVNLDLLDLQAPPENQKIKP